MDQPFDETEPLAGAEQAGPYAAQIARLYKRVTGRPVFSYDENGASASRTMEKEPGALPGHEEGGGGNPAFDWYLRRLNSLNAETETGGKAIPLVSHAEARTEALLSRLDALFQHPAPKKGKSRRGDRAKALRRLAEEMALSEAEGMVSGQLAWAALGAAQALLKDKKKKKR